MPHSRRTFSQSWGGRAIALGLLAAGAVPAAVALAAYTIDGAVIASGVSEFHGSACYTMSATSGQAVFGGVDTGANYALSAGFWRAYPADQQSVFSSSFESCP